MIWVRGAPRDFDTWAYLGAEGWSWEDVRPVYERIERREPGGPGTVSLAHVVRAGRRSTSSIAEAAQECGIPLNADYNGASQDGVSFMQYSIEDGVRHSTAAAYIRPVEAAPNLELVRAHAPGACCSTARAASASSGRRTAASSAPRADGGRPVRRDDRLGAAAPALGRRAGRAPALARDRRRRRPARASARTCTTTCSRPVIFSAEREIGPPSPGLPGLPDAPLLALAARAAGARHPADPLHGADVRAVDGRAARTASRCWAGWCARSAAARCA